MIGARNNPSRQIHVEIVMINSGNRKENLKKRMEFGEEISNNCVIDRQKNS